MRAPLLREDAESCWRRNFVMKTGRAELSREKKEEKEKKNATRCVDYAVCF